jgi:hypothetical protein
VRIIGLFPEVHGTGENASAKIEGEDKTASLYAALLDKAECSSGPR